MKDFGDLRKLRILHCCIIVSAFVACFVTILFSWPDHHDRKRTIFPHPLRCCEIRIAHWVVVPGARAERERLQMAATSTWAADQTSSQVPTRD